MGKFIIVLICGMLLIYLSVIFKEIFFDYRTDWVLVIICGMGFLISVLLIIKCKIWVLWN